MTFLFFLANMMFRCGLCFRLQGIFEGGLLILLLTPVLMTPATQGFWCHCGLAETWRVEVFDGSKIIVGFTAKSMIEIEGLPRPFSAPKPCLGVDQIHLVVEHQDLGVELGC